MVQPYNLPYQIERTFSITISLYWRFLRIRSTLPFLAGSLTHPSSKAFFMRPSPIPGARIRLFCVFVHFCLPCIILFPWNSHFAWGRDLHSTDRGTSHWIKLNGCCVAEVLGQLPAFPLGITSLAVPAKPNEGRSMSKEKGNLFISNFLPLGCHMETRQDISIQFSSSKALFFILILHFRYSL